MKSVLFALALLCLSTICATAQVGVHGYYRSNGTYVEPHQRTYPNSTPRDNYSYPGNYNPNTGGFSGGGYPYSGSNSGYTGTGNYGYYDYRYGYMTPEQSRRANRRFIIYMGSMGVALVVVGIVVIASTP